MNLWNSNVEHQKNIVMSLYTKTWIQLIRDKDVPIDDIMKLYNKTRDKESDKDFIKEYNDMCTKYYLGKYSLGRKMLYCSYQLPTDAHAMNNPDQLIMECKNAIIDYENAVEANRGRRRLRAGENERGLLIQAISVRADTILRNIRSTY